MIERLLFTTHLAWTHAPRVIIGAAVLVALTAFPAGARSPQGHSTDRGTITVPADGRFHTVRSRIRDMVARDEVPSMAVAVAQNGKIVWEEAFGWADRENKIPATPSTIYRVGSLSKSIMATGVMTLVEKGTVTLDDRVDQRIAPVALTIHEGNAADLKLRHLLNMTGGIPHGSLGLYDWKDVPRTEAQQTEYAKHVPIVVFPPGEVYEYSNLSIGLTELVVERATTLPLAQFMRNEVFEPLGMHRTGVWLDGALAPFAAVAYSTPTVPRTRNAYLVPAGGLGFVSSAHDLAMFGMFHLKTHRQDQRQILSDRTLDLMQSYAEGPQGRRFALGWFNVGDQLVSDGQVGGGNSNLTLIPSANAAIVVLTNMTSRGASAVAGVIAHAIADVVTAEARDAAQPRAPQNAAPAATPFKPASELLGIWTGTIKAYGGDIPITLAVADSGSVRVQLADQPPQWLEGVVFNRFRQLRGDFTGRIRTVESRDAELQSGMSLTARLADGRMYGYVQAQFSTDRGSFALPLYVSLTRQQ